MFPKGLMIGLSMLILAAAALIVDERNGRAQNRNVPNLSGTWELIEYDGKTQRELGSKFPEMTLVISQTDSEIKFTQKRIGSGVGEPQEFTYYLDGRGETNTGRVELWPRYEPGLQSITQWRKDKLLSDYKEQLSLMTGYSTTNGDYSTRNTFGRRKDEWKLASDGKTLSLTSSSVRMNSGSITARQPVPAGRTLDDRGQIAPTADFDKKKLVFRKIS